MSKLEFEEIGLDALDTKTIKSLRTHSEYMKRSYQPINLQSDQKKGVDSVHISQVFQESSPFQTAPHSSEITRKVDSFKIGSRIVNLNSQLKEFIPFGLRGTVIGKTENSLVVLFDQQFLGASRDIIKS